MTYDISSFTWDGFFFLQKYLPGNQQIDITFNKLNENLYNTQGLI